MDKGSQSASGYLQCQIFSPQYPPRVVKTIGRLVDQGKNKKLEKKGIVKKNVIFYYCKNEKWL